MGIDRQLLEQTAEELFQEAPCGFLVTLADGSIIKVNETFLAWTGHSREALLSGVTFQTLLSVPGRIYYDTHISPLLQMQGFVREVAFDLNRPGAAALPIIFNCIRKESPGAQPTVHRITVFDATDRRQYEREILLARRKADQAAQTERSAREEAERANRAKDDFLALVSHELRTPLSAIIGWSQVLRRKLAGNPEAERGLSVIEHNGNLQVRLVEDLLDMSRITSGKMRLDVQSVDLAVVVDAAIETARPAAIARNIRLQPALDTRVTVSGDPGRLQQVFWNLLTNAVKFTPKGGYVRVVMERVNSHVEISVIDSGQGMSVEFLTHAFERFRQSDSIHTRENSGLGLGLSLVKHLVEMHGGTIEARSEGKDQGSTFVVRLPAPGVRTSEGTDRLDSRAPVFIAAAEQWQISLVGLKIAIVDDEADARELLANVLTDCGAEVIVSKSASEALGVVESCHPDVLISDVGLCGEDGYELIRKIRMLGDRGGRIPAIALTALSRLEDRTQALLAGFQIHLSKPVDPHELAVTVASLAGRLARPNQRA